MNNEPLNSNEQSKIILFAIMVLPSIVFAVGIIPVGLIIFGIYMMKKNRDFTPIDAITKAIKIYIIAGTVIGALIFVGVYIDLEHIGYIMSAFTVIALGIFYIFIVNNWFYSTLKLHSEWVVKNGVFSTKKT